MIKDLDNEKWRITDTNDFIYESNYGRIKQRVNIKCEKDKLIYNEILIFGNEEFINAVYDNEIWVNVNNKIKISNYGRIKKNNILFYTKINKKGYCTVCVNNKSEYVHRLVAKYFIPNNDINKTEIDHINTNKSDNRVDNLRWVTREENLTNPITLERINKYKGLRKFIEC